MDFDTFGSFLGKEVILLWHLIDFMFCLGSSTSCLYFLFILYCACLNSSKPNMNIKDVSHRDELCTAFIRFSVFWHFKKALHKLTFPEHTSLFLAPVFPLTHSLL